MVVIKINSSKVVVHKYRQYEQKHRKDTVTI